jgi:hypothetical protein
LIMYDRTNQGLLMIAYYLESVSNFYFLKGVQT